MKDKVLFVDDDANILNGYRRTLRRVFDIDTALGPEEGFELLARSGPYAVVVSDYRMPQMSGVQFLTAAKDHSPNTVRVILSGQADMEAAINAINEGQVFRFIKKPCPPEELIRILEDCMVQFNLVNAEEVLLQKTLKECAKVLTDVMSAASPLAFGRAMRVTRYIKQVVEKLGLTRGWKYELAGMLSQIGTITIPNEVLKKLLLSEKLDAGEEVLVNQHPKIAKGMIEKIPRLEKVGEIVSNQFTIIKPQYGIGRGLNEMDEVTVGTHLLTACLEFDRLQSLGMSQAEAVQKLEYKGEDYHQKVLEALKEVTTEEGETKLMAVVIEKLLPGMILADDVGSTSGMLLVPKGQEVNELIIERLKSFHKRGEIGGSVRVYLKA